MEPWIKNPVAASAREFFRRHWQRALRWRERVVVNEEAFHLMLAGIVGIIGGLVNVFFFYAGEMVQRIFLSQPGAGLITKWTDPVQAAESFTAWQRLLVPTLGGLVAGLILHWGLRWIGSQGSSDLLEVVVAGDGRLPARTESVKTASALVSIATGASIGREGGIVHLSATLASKLGQIAKWPPYRLRLLVGCGAAAGIASAYNAPIAGAVFASLIVLGNFSMNLFAPLVFASVIATMTSRTFFGIKPWYQVPKFPDVIPAELPWFLVLGVLCGCIAALFLKLLRGARERSNQLHWPIYWKLALAGLVVGVVALEFPEVCGNGYFATNSILNGGLGQNVGSLPHLTGVFFGKVLATTATVGAGTVGGVFTPTLFLGACTGALFGAGLHLLGCATALPPGAFALVGMGAILSGTTKSPLLAMIMTFEISLDYSLVPALMLACVVSVLIARQLHRDSVYTEHLRLKGLSFLSESQRTGAAMEKFVGDLMRAPIPPLPETATLRKIAESFMANSNNFLPIVDKKQRLTGIVALQDLKGFLNEKQDFHGVIAYDVMRLPPKTLTPGQRLLDALPIVLESELRNVPVVNNQNEKRLVGSVSRAEVLATFSEAIAEQSKPTQSNPAK
ncbi:MAG: ClcB-like voltage-gated chloride channel protein [Limisphaerales bacterium]